MKWNAIELFCCSGGMGLGFRRAGIEFLMAVDRSADACASYEANLGVRPVQIDVHDLLQLTKAGWQPPALDLVVADPPCTPWSRAGNREGLDDPRDCLQVTVELIRWWRPRAYLIGNVPGLDDSCNWPIVQKLLAPLAEIGYCITDFCRLNAADYGVPQCRVRPFWFGHHDSPCLYWPQPTHADPAQLTTRSLFAGDQRRPWVTARDALADWPKGSIGRTKKAGSEPEWPWDRPSTTVCASPNIPAPGCHGNSGYHSAPNAVILTEQAATVLQGFPLDWRFCGRTKKARWEQIGQAMPPALAEAIARSILARWS